MSRLATLEHALGRGAILVLIARMGLTVSSATENTLVAVNADGHKALSAIRGRTKKYSVMVSKELAVKYSLPLWSTL